MEANNRPCAGCGLPAHQMPGHYRRRHADGRRICKPDLERTAQEHAEMAALIELLAKFCDTYETMGNNRKMRNNEGVYSLNTGGKDAIEITVGDLRKARALLAKVRS